MKKTSFTKKLFTFLLVISFLSMLALTAHKLYTEQAPPPPSEASLQPPVQDKIPSSQRPALPSPNMYSLTTGLHERMFMVGKLGPTTERREYVSGDIMLNIPKLNLMTTVLSIPLDESMKKAEKDSLSDFDTQVLLLKEINELLDEGVTLMNESALPGIGNRNVSISAHRDAKNKEFYYIDTLTEGDIIYLTYKNRQYIYLYESTLITDDSDWEPLKSKDYNLITLMSCDPILPANGLYDRIFVTAKLTEILFLDPSEYEEYRELALQGPDNSTSSSSLEESSKEDSSSVSSTPKG